MLSIGDIGTSTLYGLKQAVEAAGAPTPDTVMGVVSLILWALLLIVALKYAILILRADNHGEGGIVALLALLDARRAPRGSWRASLLIVGLVGAALLYGDGVITPAISVLSAVEGLKIDAPGLAPMVVPITIAILASLFLVQRRGTEFIGRIFGPVMLVWFVAIGLLGLLGIMQTPGILAAISPHYAVGYLVHAGPGIAFAVLGAAFLALTGAEAMYADMGHFGRLPIQLGWFAIVLSLKWGYNPLMVAAVNGFFLVIELIFISANMTKLIQGGWFPLLLAGVIAFLMLTWRTGWQLLEHQRSRLRQREDEFVAWVLDSRPIRLSGAAAIFTAASTGIPLGLTHHLRHNRVLHERVLLIASISTDKPRVEPEQRIRLVPVCAGITRVLLHFGFMETPNVMEGLKRACQEPELRGIDPENITYYFRRVMVIPSSDGMAGWRKSLFAMMHLNANLPAAYFGVPPAQVVEVGLEVEI